jgi:Carbohydrate family 9 binding domain-like
MMHALAHALFVASVLQAQSSKPADPSFPPPGDPTPQKPEHAPRSYDAKYAVVAPKLDGKLDDPEWLTAPWTEAFVDIQGSALPAPRHRTRAKMLWDDKYFYIAAQLDEPHVWATLRKHDEIVFHDNDFEVFIDPDGDAREYYELEVNAFGTIFDLFLHRRYKDGGPAEHGWNAEGLKTAIHVNGTLNDPTDTDKGWTLEWAIPWSAFKPPAWDKPGFGEKERGAAAPKPGETWRVNFSRVQWQHNFEGTTAEKPVEKPINDSFDQKPPKPGENAKPAYAKTAGKPEDNWVWTPQWQIDMHDPRWWGRVRFTRP